MTFEMFNSMPKCDSWNTMLSIFFQHDFWVQSLSTFVEMWSQGVRLKFMTYTIEHNTVSYTYDLEYMGVLICMIGLFKWNYS